jgi:hypothetical protein
MERLETPDPIPHVRQIRDALRVLTEHMRHDLSILDDVRARELFETSAEVLDGLGRAFTHYESKID